MAAKPAADSAISGNLKSRWGEILEGVKKAKITTYAFLVEAELVEEYTGEVVLGFKTGHTFHKERIEQAENRQVVEQVMQNVAGHPVRVKCRMQAVPEPPAAKKPEHEPGEGIFDLVAEVFDQAGR